MAQGDSQIQGVVVEIFGEQYRIGGDPRQVQQVAAYVDAKMKEIAAKSPRTPKGQLALLAAMEVTAELFKVMSERKAFTERANEAIQRLSGLVEERAGMAGPTRRVVPDVDGVLPDGLATHVRTRRPLRIPDATPAE